MNQPKTVDSHISEIAMLVKLTRRKFNHNICDKNLTEEANKEHKTTVKNALRVMKTIVSKEFVSEYTRIINEAGTYYYEVTLPWYDNGWRMLPATMFDAFSEKFRGFNTRLDVAVNNAAKKLEEEIQKQQGILGTAFNEKDYPSADEFRKSCSITVDYDSVKSGDDFRANITETQRQIIISEINRKNDERLNNVNTHLWERLFDVTSKMAAALGEKDKIFRDSLIGNIADLCDILPKLNINGDLELDKKAQEVKSLLASYDPQVLRDNPSTRKEAAREAKAQADSIAEQMGGIF